MSDGHNFPSLGRTGAIVVHHQCVIVLFCFKGNCCMYKLKKANRHPCLCLWCNQCKQAHFHVKQLKLCSSDCISNLCSARCWREALPGLWCLVLSAVCLQTQLCWSRVLHQCALGWRLAVMLQPVDLPISPCFPFSLLSSFCAFQINFCNRPLKDGAVQISF